MKRNKFLLSSQLRSKILGDLTTAYITEAFVCALPFNEDQVVTEHDNFGQYAMDVVNTMHPETLIKNALESATNASTRVYLKNLLKAFEGIADSAAKRIVESDELETAGTPEIVEQATLDSKEVDRFVEASKKNGVDAVAALVKDKMLETIKAERQDFEKSEKLRQEIREVIKSENDQVKDNLSQDDDDDENGPTMEDVPEDSSEKTPEEEFGNESALESFYNIILSPTDPRKPISVFSKMQDVCMEAISRSVEEYNEVPYETLKKITLEHTFPFFDNQSRSLVETLESLSVVTESDEEECSEEEKAEKMKKIAKTAFISTITIMTLLEVLKTTNLAKPTLADVQKFVNTPTKVADDPASPEKVEKDVDEATNSIKKSVALGAMGALELQEVREALMHARNILSNSKALESNADAKTRIMNKIDNALAITANESTTEAPFDTFSSRLKQDNIIAMEHAVHLLSQKPMTNSVRICVKSTDKTGADNESIELAAEAMNAANVPVARYNFKFNTPSFLGESVAAALMECATYCDFSRDKQVDVYYTDSGYKVPIQ